MNRHIKCLDSIPGKQNIDKSSMEEVVTKRVYGLKRLKKISALRSSLQNQQVNFFATNVSSVQNELVGYNRIMSSRQVKWFM